MTQAPVFDPKVKPAPSRAGLRLFLVVVMGVLAIANVVGASYIPQYERIFADMLGTPAKLPTLTQWVLVYGRMLGGVLPYLVILLSTSVAGFVVMKQRQLTLILVPAIGVTLALGAHLLVGAVALQLPLVQIIQCLQTP